MVWGFRCGIQGAAISYVFAQFFATFILLSWIFPHYNLKPRWIPPIPQALIKKGFIYSVSLMVLALNYRIDVVMLGNMRPEESVGLYSVGVNICELLKNIPLSVGVVIFSHATTWQADAIDESLKKIAMATRVLFFLSIIAAILLVSDKSDG